MSLHSKPHRYGVCVFSCNLPPAPLAKWLGSFTCYCVTRGWNGYWNKSQHRKLTLEKKVLPLLLPGLEPGTFRSRVGKVCPNNVTWFCTCLCRNEDTMNYVCGNILCMTCSLLWPFSANRSPKVQKSLSFALKKIFLRIVWMCTF